MRFLIALYGASGPGVPISVSPAGHITVTTGFGSIPHSVSDRGFTRSLRDEFERGKDSQDLPTLPNPPKPGRARRQNRQILPNFGKAYRSYSTSTTCKSDTTVTKRKQSHAVCVIPAWPTKRDSRRWNGTMSITRFTSVLAALVTSNGVGLERSCTVVQAICLSADSSPTSSSLHRGYRHLWRWPEAQDRLVRHLSTRIYMNVQRPNDAYPWLFGKHGDFTWGNRFDLGLCRRRQQGMDVHHLAYQRPQQEDIVITERINRV